MIERPAIRRGTYASVRDLNAKIRAFIDGWSDRFTPSSDQAPLVAASNWAA